VSTATPDGVTLERFGAIYTERLGKPVSQNHQACFRQFIAFTAPNTATRYGARVLTAFTEDDIEAFFGHLRAKDFAESTRNKYIQMVKALFRWATKKGYLTRNPTADSEILKRRKHAQRHRRLEPGEEARLLEHAGPHLQQVIIGALETCARLGELLALQWRDVSIERRELLIRAEEEGARKTGAGRWLPVSARLAAVLEMARTDHVGQAFGPEAYVFGDAVGRRVKAIKRAWETCLLKAHGYTPAWHRHDLTPECRQALDAIDLHFHDLRHEAGSRLLEAGWPLHTISHMLGHANIAQTSTYLNATKVGLQEAMRRLDASRCNPVAIQPAAERAPRLQRTATDASQPLVN
jgi:integrase